MATFYKSTNQENPHDGNPSPFPSFGNVGAPCMATLSLPSFTIGFSVWLFSASLILSVQTAFQPSSPPPKQHQPHVDPKVDPFPSSLVQSSSSLSNEILQVSNQVDKKKQKRKIKKKKNMRGKTK